MSSGWTSAAERRPRACCRRRPRGPAGRRPRWCPARRARPRRPPGCRRTCCRGRPGAAARPAAPSPMQAPIGSPPPSPLARVSTSGDRRRRAWCANQAPVRPMPLWISSSTSSAPAASHARRAALRYRAGGGTTPPSPWQGSRNTAAQSSGGRLRRARPRRRRARTAPRPPNGPNGWRYRLFAGQRERAHGAAVETALGGDDDRAGLALVAADQLERRLVGLGARVGRRTPGRRRAEQGEQALGQGDLALVQEQVGGVGEQADLAGHRLGDRRVSVAERADRDAGDQVGVLAGRRRPRPGSPRRAAAPAAARRSCA